MSDADTVNNWGTKRIAMIASTTTAVIGTIIAMMHFGEIAEPYWFATRQFTRDLIKASDSAALQRSTVQTQQMLSVQLAVKEGERRSIQGRLDRSDLELRKLPQGSPDSLAEFISQQSRTYRRQMDTIDAEIGELRRQQSGGHP